MPVDPLYLQPYIGYVMYWLEKEDDEQWIKDNLHLNPADLPAVRRALQEYAEMKLTSKRDFGNITEEDVRRTMDYANANMALSKLAKTTCPGLTIEECRERYDTDKLVSCYGRKMTKEEKDACLRKARKLENISLATLLSLSERKSESESG